MLSIPATTKHGGCRRLCAALLLTVTAGLSGCAIQSPDMSPSPEFAPVAPVPRELDRPITGSIFGSHREESWFGQKREYRVGDVVTVILSENTQSSRAQSASVSRESSTDAISPKAAASLRKGLGLPSDIGLNGATIESTGGGTAEQEASLLATIAVTIVEVQANGNLVIRGEKKLNLTEGGELVQVSGTIRSRDIAPDNTVLSRRIANAQINYQGRGDVARASRPGWLTRFLLNFWLF